MHEKCIICAASSVLLSIVRKSPSLQETVRNQSFNLGVTANVLYHKSSLSFVIHAVLKKGS